MTKLKSNPPVSGIPADQELALARWKICLRRGLNMLVTFLTYDHKNRREESNLMNEKMGWEEEFEKKFPTGEIIEGEGVVVGIEFCKPVDPEEIIRFTRSLLETETKRVRLDLITR